MKHARLAAILLGLFLCLAPGARADTLGQSRTFFVNSFYDAGGASSIPATLRAVGQWANFYVDDRHWGSLSTTQQATYQAALTELSVQFDTVIHPRITAFWGSEASPGVDGDPRITVLLQRLITGNGGYFETIHNYPVQQAPQGNAREMVFVSADSVLQPIAKSFLAHEFQHLVSFYRKELTRNVQDDIWVNEARSEYSLSVAGYSEPYAGSTLQRRAQGFLQAPSDSLVEWPNTATDYAISSLFIHYAAERYGTPLLTHTLQSSLTGTGAINEWLSRQPAPGTFRDLFSDWMVAVYANDRSLGAAYGYTGEGLSSVRVAPSSSGRLSVDSRLTWNVQAKEWQPLWLNAEVASTGSTAAVQVHVQSPVGLHWSGRWVADYGGVRRAGSWDAPNGAATFSVPTADGGRTLRSVAVMLAHGTLEPVGERTLSPQSVSVGLSLGSGNVQTVTPATGTGSPAYVEPRNGDLIRRAGQQEVYVVWGPYRRFLAAGTLELYGFQSRAVSTVPDDVFFRYEASNYVRAQSREEVYAVWPDGTKHWLDISAAQWEASGRDWNAVFTVNDAEVASYRTGASITR